MEYNPEYNVAILRPPVASRLAWYSNTLEPWDLQRGLEISRWMTDFRRQAERVANLLGRKVNVHEYQVHAKGSIVPNYEKRKRVKQADLIAVVDPDDNFFQFLEEGPMRENPMVTAIIGQLSSNRDTMRELITQLPEIPLMEFNADGEMQFADRVATTEVRRDRILPALLRRAMAA